MRKTIKLRTDFQKIFGFAFGYHYGDNSFMILLPFITMEIRFISETKDPAIKL